MQLLALSGDNVFLLLLLIAVLAFVLGIGLPTVSVYILTATLAGAGAGQARRHADGRAHVRHVQRHAVDDHAAGGVRRLCGRQYRAHRRLDHGLDRLPGRLEHVHPAVPVRADAEPADGRPGLSDRAQFRAACCSACSSARPPIVGFALAPLSLPMRVVYRRRWRCRSCCRRNRSRAGTMSISSASPPGSRCWRSTTSAARRPPRRRCRS